MTKEQLDKAVKLNREIKKVKSVLNYFQVRSGQQVALRKFLGLIESENDDIEKELRDVAFNSIKKYLESKLIEKEKEFESL